MRTCKTFMAPLGALFIAMSGCIPVQTAGHGRHKTPERFFENGEATVTVKEIGTGIGTGVVVDPRGFILTNHHIIAEKTVTVRDGEKTRTIEGTGRFEVCVEKDDVETCMPAEIIASDPRFDLALIKVDRRFSHAVTFSLETPGAFDIVYAWGNLRDITGISPFHGRMVNPVQARYAPEPDAFLVFDLAENPGGSGSPVFDRTGRCVAIVTSVTPPPGRSMTFATSAKYAVEFLESHGLRPQQ